MIDLTADHHRDLQRLARIGERGLLLGDEIPTGTALHLQTLGFAKVSETRPQKAIVTASGKSHAWRGAA